MTPGECADAVLEALAISSVGDLDVEAIAFDAGIEVRFETLNGCEATLVGFENRAIATVTPSPYAGRTRFTIAHEIGHWELHRGRTFRCRVDALEENFSSSRDAEKEADTFAAHLLMPSALFKPAIKAMGQPNFKQLGELATSFDTSLTATALRLVGVDTVPAVIACYTQAGLKWHVSAKHVPRRWFLKGTLDEESFTYDLVHNGKECSRLGKQSADAWFENQDADRFEVLEQCVRLRGDEALVLLYLASDMMAHARFDPAVGNRRYNEHGSYVPPRQRR